MPHIPTGPRELLDPFEARAWLLDRVPVIQGATCCALERAQGRVLAEDIQARRDMPGVDNSAMDGYALRLADLAAATVSSTGLAVTDRLPAGAGVTTLAEGGCARIFTGAPVPQGADCVVPQERVRLDEQGRVKVLGEVQAGANIRRQGEEYRRGDPLLSAGTPLTPTALAVLASQGIAEVSVRPPLTVALISTGDELAEIGASAPPEAVFNSNRVMLKALLEQQACKVLDLGIVADTADALHEALSLAHAQADLVICTGGVSVGEEDHVRPLLESLGSCLLHGLAMKPGKPFTFGYLGASLAEGTPLIGLPGNPVAALVGWQLLALPFVQRCLGRQPAELQRFAAVAGFSRPTRRTRHELLRAVLEWREDDPRPLARLAGGQGSNMLLAANQAHGYLLVPVGRGVEEGEEYAFLPFSQFAE